MTQLTLYRIYSNTVGRWARRHHGNREDKTDCSTCARASRRPPEQQRRRKKAKNHRQTEELKSDLSAAIRGENRRRYFPGYAVRSRRSFTGSWVPVLISAALASHFGHLTRSRRAVILLRELNQIGAEGSPPSTFRWTPATCESASCLAWCVASLALCPAAGKRLLHPGPWRRGDGAVPAVTQPRLSGEQTLRWSRITHVLLLASLLFHTRHNAA